MDMFKDKISVLYQKFLWPSLFAALVTTIYSFVDTIAIEDRAYGGPWYLPRLPLLW